MRHPGAAPAALATSGRDVFPGTADAEIVAGRPRRPAARPGRPVRPPGLPRPAPARQPARAAFDDGNGQRIMLGSMGVKAAAGDNHAAAAAGRTFDTLTADARRRPLLLVREVRRPGRVAPRSPPGADPSTNAPPAAADRHERVRGRRRTTSRTSTTSATTRSTAATSSATPAARASARRSTTCRRATRTYQARLAAIADQITGDLHAPDILLVAGGRGPGHLLGRRGRAGLRRRPTTRDGKPDTLQELALADRRRRAAGATTPPTTATAPTTAASSPAFLYRTDRVSLAAGDGRRPGARRDAERRLPGARAAVQRRRAEPEVAQRRAAGRRRHARPASTAPTSTPARRRWPSSSSAAAPGRRRARSTLWAVSNHFSSTPDARVGQRREQAALRRGDRRRASRPATRRPGGRYGGDLNVFPRPDDPFARRPADPSDQLGAAVRRRAATTCGTTWSPRRPSAAYSYVFHGRRRRSTSCS